MPFSAVNKSFFDGQTQTGEQHAWVDLSNVEASDNAFSVAQNVGPDGRTNILHVFNMFNFNVDDSYSLEGIQIKVEWNTPEGTMDGTILRLEQNQAAISGADDKAPVTVPQSETVDSFGSASDLWNTGFTTIGDLAPEGGTVDDFGFAIEATQVTGTAAVQIDSVQCIITYGLP